MNILMMPYKEKRVYFDNIRVDISSLHLVPIASLDDNVPVQYTFICGQLNTVVIIYVVIIINSDIITDIR